MYKWCTEALGLWVLGYELCTFLHYLGDLYQNVLHGIDLQWRLVFQEKLIGLFDSQEEIMDRCIEFRLRQDQLYGFVSIGDIEQNRHKPQRLRSIHSMPVEHVDWSRWIHWASRHHHRDGRLTLPKAFATVLKVASGWEYLVLAAPNWIFVKSSRLPVASMGPGMDGVIDLLFSASWMILRMVLSLSDT